MQVRLQHPTGAFPVIFMFALLAGAPLGAKPKDVALHGKQTPLSAAPAQIERDPATATRLRTGACGKDIFASTDDPDYQMLLRLFEPLQESLGRRPRMDMVPLDQQTPMESCAP